MIEWPYDDGVEFAKHGNPLFGDGWEWTPRGQDPDVFMVDAPVGEPCTFCETAIEPDDAGELMFNLETDPERTFKVVALHMECSLLSMLGHDLGVCRCTKWAGAVTLREASIEAMRRYREIHGLS